MWGTAPEKSHFWYHSFGKRLLFPAGIRIEHCSQDEVYEPRRLAVSLLTLRYFPLLARLSVSDAKKSASRVEIRAAFPGSTVAFHAFK